MAARNTGPRVLVRSSGNLPEFVRAGVKRHVGDVAVKVLRVRTESNRGRLREAGVADRVREHYKGRVVRARRRQGRRLESHVGRLDYVVGGSNDPSYGQNLTCGVGGISD